MVEGPVGPVTAAIAAFGVVAALLAARNSQDTPSAARFAGITSLIFAAQMVSFPVQDRTSGHLIGGVLASILLGIPFGILSMTIVLVIQCLLFADGGFSVLGANILNMALLGAGVGGWFAVELRRGRTGFVLLAATAGAAWISVVLAAMACSIELAASGVAPFPRIATAMLGAFALIGIGEALITVALVAVIPIRTRRATDFHAIFIPFAAAAFIAAVLSQFSSQFPDGLHWVAKELGFLPEKTGSYFAIMPGYSLPWLGGNAAPAGLAGFIGVVAVSALAIATSRLWTNRTVI
jgi:cobalt/nickel transport system permease protein